MFCEDCLFAGLKGDCFVVLCVSLSCCRCVTVAGYRRAGRGGVENAQIS